MAKRRSNGEGSYYQRPDRTWVHQITLGRKEDGTLIRKSFKGRTKAICTQRKEEWLAEQARLKEQAEVERQEAAEQEDIVSRLGHSLESETLFETAFMEWLKLYKSPPARKPSTYASYIATYNTHFAPALWDYAASRDHPGRDPGLLPEETAQGWVSGREGGRLVPQDHPKPPHDFEGLLHLR